MISVLDHGHVALRNLAGPTDLPELSFTDDLTTADRDAGWASTALFIEVEMPRGR